MGEKMTFLFPSQASWMAMDGMGSYSSQQKLPTFLKSKSHQANGARKSDFAQKVDFA